ncbi:hypothetical protein F2Q69_00049844 [Brassica cretica]|uniref:Uncharacterized protein n=1 Tax=Brassica cretica TaxID=69181 RepID=A0A8S9PQ11_BRACR|nr:hypothetical protein F2Q69_00049844 [Brassica cretica]
MIATGRRERWSDPSWRARDMRSRRGDREGGGIVEESQGDADSTTRPIEREAESSRRPMETRILRPQRERRRFHRYRFRLLPSTSRRYHRRREIIVSPSVSPREKTRRL